MSDNIDNTLTKKLANAKKAIPAMMKNILQLVASVVVNSAIFSLILLFLIMPFPSFKHSDAESTATTLKFLFSNFTIYDSVREMRQCLVYRTSMPEKEAANITKNDCEIEEQKTRLARQYAEVKENKQKAIAYQKNLDNCYAFLKTMPDRNFRIVSLDECVYPSKETPSFFTREVEAFTKGQQSKPQHTDL